MTNITATVIINNCVVNLPINTSKGVDRVHNNSENSILKKLFPKIGLRTIKTLLSVGLVAFLYSLIDRNPCFACIGAVFGMGKFFKGGLKSGGNRFIGTFIGGIFVIPTYWLMNFSNLPVPHWIWLMMGLFLVLYVSQILGVTDAIQPGTVVFFVVIYTVVKEKYITYTIARILDTGLGVLVSLIINAFLPSPHEDKRILIEEANELEEEADSIK